MRILRLVVPIVGATLVVGGCGPAIDPSPISSSATGVPFPVAVTTCGYTAQIATAPRRIVTANQGATEVALALGVADRMAGTAYLDDAVAPRFLEQYNRIPVLAKEYPTTEKLLSVHPDLVYASYHTAFTAQSLGDRAKLATVGVPTLLSPSGCARKPDRAAWAQVWDELDSAGKAFGVRERASALIAQQKSELGSDLIRTAAAGKRILWWDSKTTAPYVGAGKGTPRLLIEAVGASNVFAGLPGNWADVSLESVISTNPDVIVLADASWDEARSRIDFARAHPALSKLRAVRENRFVVIPFSETTSGVRLVDGARRLADGIRAFA